jgi:hypothetical protein
MRLFDTRMYIRGYSYVYTRVDTLMYIRAYTYACSRTNQRIISLATRSSKLGQFGTAICRELWVIKSCLDEGEEEGGGREREKEEGDAVHDLLLHLLMTQPVPPRSDYASHRHTAGG